MEIRIGTSGYSYRWWRGAFYPPNLRQGAWFTHYAAHFDTVEINASFYRLPRPQLLERWRRTAPKGFLFAMKGWRTITHLKKLADCADPLGQFIDAVRLLGDKLGPLLWQLPPSLHRDDGRLAAFLELLPGDLTHVFEFRHDSWFVPTVRDLLEAHGCAFCQHDHHGMTTPPWITGGMLYRRFHGTMRGRCYGEEALRKAATYMCDVVHERGVGRIFAYFNNDANACAPADAKLLRDMLAGVCGENGR